MATLADIVIDCHHPASLARFWQDVLDDYVIAPYDDAELERLSAVGVLDLEDDPTVLLICATTGPRIWFQRVDEPKTAKNRVHLDVRANDMRAEVTRLCGLGATVVTEQPDKHLATLCDPEGNEFCVIE